MEPLRKEEALETLLEDVGSLVEELCQSGFDTLHDSTLETLEELAKVTGQYQMGYLSHRLGELSQGLLMRRHQLGQPQDAVAETYVGIIEYLYLCREKIALDRARGYYACEEAMESEEDR
ncbi:hypothetical protein IMSAGC019_00247 [Lachnospiraceae bacterium]|nr:hypothetical protein IMSAGC019_00247 [Lachnospiraceae bacterium]